MKKSLIIICLIIGFCTMNNHRVIAQSFINGSFEQTMIISDSVGISASSFNSNLTGVNASGNIQNLDIINSLNQCGAAQNGTIFIAMYGNNNGTISLKLTTPINAGVLYKLCFYDRACAPANSLPLNIGVSDNDSTQGTLFYNTPFIAKQYWTKHTISFIAPVTGQYITLGISGGSNTDKVQFDNFAFNCSTLEPVVDFDVSDSTLCQNECVNFTDSIGASATACYWVFDGANTSTSFVQNPSSICYDTAGIFDVSLTAENDSGTVTVIKPNYITVDPLPIVLIAGNNTLCMGDTIHLFVSGGAPYTWSPSVGLNNTSISNPLAFPITNTTYTVTATNLCGTASESIAITVLLPPIAHILNNDTSICKNDTVHLSANGGTLYQWYPFTGLNNENIPNPLATPQDTTIYTVLVSNVCGTSTDEVTITVIPAAHAVITGNDVICEGQNTQLTGTGGNTYVWSPSTGLSGTTIYNPVAQPTVTSTYTLTVTNTCGTSSENVIINVDALPIAYAGSDTSVCGGSSVNLNATGGVSYQWSPPSSLNNPAISSPVATPTFSTTYTVTATNQCGTDSDNVIISILSGPTINAGTDTSVCYGASVLLQSTATGIGTLTYTWSPSESLVNSTTNTPTANPLNATTYTVTVSSDCGFATDNVSVSINPLPVAHAGADTVMCQGIPYILSGSGGTTFQWTPATGLSNANIANPIAMPNSDITYILSAINACGTSKDTMQISIVEMPDANAGTDDSVCVGKGVLLVATGGTTFAWSTGSTNDSTKVIPSTSTTYTVTASNSCGISTDQVKIVVLPIPEADAGSDTTIKEGTSAHLLATGGSVYLWTPSAGLSNPKSDNPIASPLLTTAYTVLVSNGYCSASATVVVHVEEKKYEIFVPTAFTPNIGGGDGHNDIFRPLPLGLPGFKDFNMQIYNRWGMLIFETDNASSGWDGFKSSNPIDIGAYLYKIIATDPDGKKIVITGDVLLIR